MVWWRVPGPIAASAGTIGFAALTTADTNFRRAVFDATIADHVALATGASIERLHGSLARELSDGGVDAITLDDHRVGVIRIAADDDHLDLVQLEILPDHQGRGIGSAIIAALQAEATHTDRSVRLQVFVSNTAAHALYRRLGFTAVADDGTTLTMIWPPSDAALTGP